jgi:hypothetical protein
MTIRLKPEVVVITLTNLHHEVGHDPLCCSQQPRRPRYRVERAAMEIRLAAETNPSCNRKDEIYSCIVEHSCEAEIVFPIA